MKLTILGGGGVRTPLLVNGLIRNNDKLGITELFLFEKDKEKFNTIGKVIEYIADKFNCPFSIIMTDNIEEAVRESDFIYTALRVGGDKGRIIDEKVALKYGVLGQETVGAGGFAMALRTIPVLLDYFKYIEEYAPDAWVINFTNPSGIITQALKEHTNHKKIIGICDAPSQMKREIADFLNVEEDSIFVNYFGLNHFGWINKLMINGEDKLEEIIQSDTKATAEFLKQFGFEDELIKTINLIPNEYLYYYYYRTEAVNNILNSKETRGGQIKELNNTLINEVKAMVDRDEMELALETYLNIMSERTNTYMIRETGNKNIKEDLLSLDVEGYEGLAISIMDSIINNNMRTLALNVESMGNIKSLGDNEIIETTCLIDGNGPVPLSIGEIPLGYEGLIKNIKEFEKLTISAAINGNYQDAVLALTIHPLVMSYTIAKNIVDDYLIYHKEYLPQFN